MIADGVEFRTKPDWKWRHWYLGVAAFFAGDAFVERFATTRGDTVYEASGKTSSDALLAHEWRHVKQERADGIWYILGYLLCQAKRYAYELEAFNAQMKHHFETRQQLPESYVERIADIATHDFYHYSDERKKRMRQDIYECAERIRDGK